MKRLLSALVVAISTASAAGAWEFVFIEGRGAGTLEACAAVKTYRDAFFTIRLYGDEMDFVFQNDEFALPYGELLGPVSLRIGTESFIGAAFSFDRDDDDVRPNTSTMQITPRREDYGPLFDALRAGQLLIISFPSDDTYRVDLNGSARALNKASDCWRSRETGPDEKNPFEVPKKTNPFEAVPETSSNPFEKPV